MTHVTCGLTAKNRDQLRMWRCDNVGGLGEHVTCHMFWFLSRPFCHSLIHNSIIEFISSTAIINRVGQLLKMIMPSILNLCLMLPRLHRQHI